jgi:hypothetical protein
LLGTHETPDQFIVRTGDDAVSRGVAYARRQRVRAWFAEAGGNFVLLGTFRDEDPGGDQRSGVAEESQPRHRLSSDRNVA